MQMQMLKAVIMRLTTLAIIAIESAILMPVDAALAGGKAAQDDTAKNSETSQFPACFKNCFHIVRNEGTPDHMKIWCTNWCWYRCSGIVAIPPICLK
jgi:hypothetical protein